MDFMNKVNNFGWISQHCPPLLTRKFPPSLNHCLSGKQIHTWNKHVMLTDSCLPELCRVLKSLQGMSWTFPRQSLLCPYR